MNCTSTCTVCESEDGGWTHIPRRSKRVQVNEIATDNRELFGVHKQPDRRQIDNVLSKYEPHVRSATQESTVNIHQASVAESTRRKTKISRKRKHNDVKSVVSNVLCQDITAEYVYESVGCGRAFYSERGLCVHKRTCQKRQALLHKPVGSLRMSASKKNKNNAFCRNDNCLYPWVSSSCHLQTAAERVQSDAPTDEHSEHFTSDSTSRNRRDSIYDNRSPRTTQKRHIKKCFLSTISDLEKEFLPSTRCQPQKDHLYEKLKDYHDFLLKSTSNTTTEKLSSEVIAVLCNPTVIYHCNRQFRWSKDD